MIFTGASAQSNCTVCPVGNYCPLGSITPQNCSAGTYNPSKNGTGPSNCLTCCYYNSLAGQASIAACWVCPSGSYCQANTTTPVQCAAGTYNAFTGASDRAGVAWGLLGLSLWEAVGATARPTPPRQSSELQEPTTRSPGKGCQGHAGSAPLAASARPTPPLLSSAQLEPTTLTQGRGCLAPAGSALLAAIARPTPPHQSSVQQGPTMQRHLPGRGCLAPAGCAPQGAIAKSTPPPPSSAAPARTTPATGAARPQRAWPARQGTTATSTRPHPSCATLSPTTP